MLKIRPASTAVVLSLLLLSCQKEVSSSSGERPPTASAGTLWQSNAQEALTEQITNTVKNNNDSGVTIRSRSFEKDFTFSGVACSGEEVGLAGTVNYTTTDVYDQNGNETSLKTHLILNGTGKTQDGETFRVHEVSEENYNLTGAKAGGHFLFKERWSTAHHSGTIIFDLAGKLDAVTYTFNFHIASITYQCD